jgi:hypothetical protein
MSVDIAGKPSVHFIPEPAHDHLPEGDVHGISFSDHERLPVFSLLYILNIYQNAEISTIKFFN